MRPIYFYHIMRTGGRSFSHAVIAQFKDPAEVWGRCLGKWGESPVVEVEGKKIVPWHGAPPISDFFYSWSHVPVYSVKIPKGCFTITILRDPVDRFISLFRDLKKHEWLGNAIPKIVGHSDLRRFVRKDILGTAHVFPPKDCLGQLYHFSLTGNIDEAVETIRGLSYVLRIEKYEEGLKELRRLLGLKLPYLRYTDTDIPEETYHEVAAQLTPQVVEELREIFAPEYELLERLGL